MEELLQHAVAYSIFGIMIWIAAWLWSLVSRPAKVQTDLDNSPANRNVSEAKGAFTDRDHQRVCAALKRGERTYAVGIYKTATGSDFDSALDAVRGIEQGLQQEAQHAREQSHARRR
jgi:hypothetical protein